MTGNIVVLYHENCMDGFTAAWAARKALADSAEYIPAQYGRRPPLERLAGKDVFIIDFSYKKEVLLEIGHAAEYVLVLDHHKSAKEDLEEFTVLDSQHRPESMRQFYDAAAKRSGSGRPPIIAVFDVNRSGAMLAWNFFNPGITIPPLVRYVQAYDLWHHDELPHVRAVDSYMRSFDFGFGTWDALSAQISTRLESHIVPIGEALARKHLKQVRDHVAASTSREYVNLDGFPVCVCNCPPAWSSDAGHILSERKDQLFGATYYVLPSGEYKFSLRSKDTKEDVAAIAEKFGGGGHRNAAGFIVPQMFEVTSKRGAPPQPES